MRLSLASLAVLPLGALMLMAPAPAAADGFGGALNQVRASGGLGSLRVDTRLSAAAQAHAQDMAVNGYVSHQGRDGSTSQARAQAAGCRSGYSAENIAWGQPSEQAVFSGWMQSPAHHANMMGRPYGVYGLGSSGDVWVLMLADRC